MIRIILGLVFLLSSSCLSIAQISLSSAARHVVQGNAYLMRSQFERAIKSYSSALNITDLSHDKRAAILSDRGVAYWRLKEFDKALADFTACFESNPNFPQAYNNRGNVYLETGNMVAAINDFTKAISLAPDYGISYINRGNAYYLSKDYKSAQIDFQSAMRLLPTQAIAYHGSGLTNIARGRKYAALRSMNRAVTLNKSYKSALYHRGELYNQLGFTDKALEDLSFSIRNHPDDIKLLLKRAKLRLNQKQYYAAINDIQKTLKLAPGLVDAFILRGIAYGKIKKYRIALKALNTAIEDDPDRTEGYLRRGEIYKRKGDLEKAKIDLNTAMELEPQNAEIHELLGEIAETNKEDEVALTFYKKALELDPLMSGSKEGIKRLTGSMPETLARQVGEVLGKWKILDLAKESAPIKVEGKDDKKTQAEASLAPKHKYVIINPDYPGFSAPLEMYGNSEPRLIEWTKLKKPLRGFGLLRYFAGYLDDARQIPMEYIGIISLKDKTLIAVEPFKWGDKQAKWSWRQVSVVVTDPDGIPSEIFLKKSRKSRVSSNAIPYKSFKSSRRSSAQRSGGVTSRKAKKKKRRRKNKGIFDWLF